MPYAKIDDRYADTPKVREAWCRSPAAIGLHIFAITYCNQHATDGLIGRREVDLWLYVSPLTSRQKTDAIATLLDLRLLELADDSHYQVHDFLDWNRSREQRAALAEQGRRGGIAKAAGRRSGEPDSPGSGPGPSPRSSHGYSEGHSPGSSTPRHATPTPKNVNSNAELRSAVTGIFAYWQERCGHSQAQPSDDRLGKIRSRLKERQRFHSGDLQAAVRDCRGAIDGAACCAFVDDAGKRHDGIELIFRNNSKLEDFMSRAEQRGNVVPLERPAALRRADAWKDAKEYQRDGAA